MKTFTKAFALVSAAMLGISTASAGPIYDGYLAPETLELSDAGVVGTLSGPSITGGVTNEAAAAQAILNLLQNTTASYGTQTIASNTAYDYAGTITLAGLSDATNKNDTGSTSVPSGWDYVLAKYDGPNAGYVLFFLGGNATILPTVPNTLWVSGNANDPWALSHYTMFDGTSTSVPDGGATAALLGLGIVGVGFAARRTKFVKA